MTQLAVDQKNGLTLTPFFFDEELKDLGLAGLPSPNDAAAAAVKVGQCGVIVICADEAEQQRVYEDLVGRGLTVKVVNT